MSAQLIAFKSPENGNSLAVNESVSGAFSEYMLMELVLEVARSSHDPHGRLAELFDRITTRARSGGVAHHEGATMTQFRKHAESFFLLAGKHV